MTGFTDVTGGGRPVIGTYRVDMKCNDTNRSCYQTVPYNSITTCSSPINGEAFVIGTDMSNDCQNSTTIVVPSHLGCPSGYFELTGCTVPAGGNDSRGTYQYQYCHY
jgi:hypothetical protein